ncbi:MAG TPA: tetratricopeptide repeat protein [Bryobacteraceae bacterium]|nr:tetratricopeptide repeat protein [Bryobacteraceae bacterium]
MERRCYYALATMAMVFIFAAGLKTLADFDLGWSMATGRWIAAHHQIPSTEVFSYTAAGQPWIYPVGSALIFYGAYALGGYGLISWLVALACVATVALLLRRGSAVSAGLALFAVPLIASRTTARPEMFTSVLFAATLAILWQQHETGTARLWSLPILMAAWVNLHPGFTAGLGLLAAYAMLEASDMLRAVTRPAAQTRLRRAAPWLAATGAATLANPWGWGVYQVILRQQEAMADHEQMISEWAPLSLNGTHLLSGLSLSDPFYVLLLLLVPIAAIALWRRQFGAAVLMLAAAVLPVRHERFTALFACIMTVVGGAVAASFLREFSTRLPHPRLRAIMAAAAAAALLAMAGYQTYDRASNRFYLSGTGLVEFGTGLSWWFPQKAADFVERENLPGQIFSAGNEGAYMAFRLGPKYRNYIDGRAIPFGTELMVRSQRLKATPPDAPLWKEEIERYGISTVLVPIGRFVGVQFFPAFRQFCSSGSWTPVYLDDVAVVFLRNTPETEALAARLRVDCASAPVPKSTAPGFQEWANAAGVLQGLGRDAEALAATGKALALFPENGYLHFLRGHLLQDAGRVFEAETDYLAAARYAPDMVAPWSALAAFYQQRGRLTESIRCWQTAARTSRWPWEPLVSLGYANLEARQPEQALAAFDRAANSLPENSNLLVDNNFLANIAHGRARAYYRAGDILRAIDFENQAARLLPENSGIRQQLADLYDSAGQHAQAAQVRAQAANRAN